jgi:MoaA/NifB/PqqE/SkfB family radical SAM enzyme
MVAIPTTENIRSGLSQMSIAALARGAELALRVPFLQDALLASLVRRLETSYQQNATDPELLARQRWFGQHLRTFLNRLLEERPAAARAILRFIGTWAVDVNRRGRAARTGLSVPHTVVVEATDRCNLQCPGCYANSGPDGHDLPSEQPEQTIGQVVALGVSLIPLSGGEPFLREREDQAITRLARQFPERGFLVYTNGTMIDAAVAARLATVGNVFPAISVEGFEHQTDARRGNGIYRANRRARSDLAERGVMFGFSATITRENAESICTDAFIDQRIEAGDLFGWFFLLQPIGRSPRPDLMATADQRALLRETVLRWRQEDRPIFLGDFWNDGPLVDGCMAGGRYYFHVYANGDISPCVFSPVACGNVLDIFEGRSRYESLADFIQNNPVFAAYRAEQECIHDRNRPCLLIDHPEAFRRIAAASECRPAPNMPPDYLDGEIADAVDQAADDWAARAADLPPFPRSRAAPDARSESPAGSRSRSD